MAQDEITTPRREWPRVPIPPELFDLVVTMGRSQRITERDLYLFIFLALKRGYPDEYAKFREHFNLAPFEDATKTD
jgi:hypothetical protein